MCDGLIWHCEADALFLYRNAVIFYFIYFVSFVFVPKMTSQSKPTLDDDTFPKKCFKRRRGSKSSVLFAAVNLRISIKLARW